MKKAFLALVFVSLAGMSFAAGDKYNYNYNYCVHTLNAVITENPAEVSVNLTKDVETGYDMCAVHIDSRVINFRVTSGIVLDKVYPVLSLIETNTTKKWEIRFLGDRILLFRLGGARYVFKNEKYEKTLASASPAATVVEEPQQEEIPDETAE